MYNIIETYVQKTVIEDGEYKTKIRADIAVSTVDDLPDDDTLLTDSVCYVRQAGVFYIKDDDGNWYDSSGNEPSSESTLNASLSAPKNLGSIRDEQPIEEIVEEPVETEKSVLYPDEILKEQKKAFEESIEEPEKDGEDDDELL